MIKFSTEWKKKHVPNHQPVLVLRVAEVFPIWLDDCPKKSPFKGKMLSQP
jgi:hypothetical protein